MKYPERFERAIRKLVRAFFDDELLKGRCRYCAVGNMCDNQYEWSLVFNTPQRPRLVGKEIILEQDIDLLFYRDSSKEVIDSTGYTVLELARVESAFERAEEVGDKNSLQSQFNGLMAVVDVLCDIERIEDAEPVKDMFRPKLEEVV